MRQLVKGQGWASLPRVEECHDFLVYEIPALPIPIQHGLHFILKKVGSMFSKYRAVFFDETFRFALHFIDAGPIQIFETEPFCPITHSLRYSITVSLQSVYGSFFSLMCAVREKNSVHLAFTFLSNAFGVLESSELNSSFESPLPVDFDSIWPERATRLTNGLGTDGPRIHKKISTSPGSATLASLNQMVSFDGDWLLRIVDEHQHFVAR